MSLKNTATPFARRDYSSEVKAEISAGREVNALFLIHGFIDSYLREWLFIIGKSTKDAIKKTVVEETERISFHHILIIHTILGNIDHALHGKLEQLNRTRNNLAHGLVSIDLQNEKTKRSIGNSSRSGIKICDNIFDLYKKDLDRKSKII